MKRFSIPALAALMVLAGLCTITVPARAQSGAASPPPTSRPEETAPQIPSAAPGAYSEQKRDGARWHLILNGHVFTGRDAPEKYLAWRAADLTMAQKFEWFSLIETRAKGDAAPVPQADPEGPRYSFRMDYWRPVWRYRTAGSADWKTWSPFSGVPFFADGLDPKIITDFQLSADIMLRKGAFADTHPLAFDASAVSDFLVNQVTPPR